MVGCRIKILQSKQDLLFWQAQCRIDEKQKIIHCGHYAENCNSSWSRINILSGLECWHWTKYCGGMWDWRSAVTLLFSNFKTVKTMCILRCYLRPKDLYSVKMLLMLSNSHLVCTHQSCFQVYNEHLQLYTKASFLSHSIRIVSCW